MSDSWLCACRARNTSRAKACETCGEERPRERLKSESPAGPTAYRPVPARERPPDLTPEEAAAVRAKLAALYAHLEAQMRVTSRGEPLDEEEIAFRDRQRRVRAGRP